LSTPNLLGGLAVAALLAMVGAWRLRDEEVPRLALLTAAFFIASSIRVPVPPSSVHLLLNAPVGVLLGWRAGLAIPIGLALQAVLLAHGGYLVLGVNSCVMALPALGAWLLFFALRRAPCTQHVWFRALLVAVSTVALALGAVFSLRLLCTADPESEAAILQALAFTVDPITLAFVLAAALTTAALARKVQARADFALGFVIGVLTVLATSLLNVVVLLVGGVSNWAYPAWILFVLHLPLAAVEGLALGFTVGFLARVRPELLGDNLDHASPVFAEARSSANGAVSSTNASHPAETRHPAAPPTGPARG
jgi:cobalt/nickel transport system permease protein